MWQDVSAPRVFQSLENGKGIEIYYNLVSEWCISLFLGLSIKE